MSLRDEKPLRDFEQSARNFCTLLETEPSDPKEWLQNILSALASLYAAGHKLSSYGLPDDAEDIPESLDVREEELVVIRKRINTILGPKNAYWTYFDPTITNDPTEEPVAGMLWDDLCDIYRDVKPGLNAWDTHREEYLHNIAFDWRWPLFETHWGRHAVDAMRALHQLVFGIETESWNNQSN